MVSRRYLQRESDALRAESPWSRLGCERHRQDANGEFEVGLGSITVNGAKSNRFMLLFSIGLS